MNDHSDNINAPSNWPTIFLRNKELKIQNKNPCMAIENMGPSFWPAGENDFKTAAMLEISKELEVGSSSLLFAFSKKAN